jgi:hypothetical protein
MGWQSGEHEFRYIATRMWIKILLTAVTAAFFFGAQFGKIDTARSYDLLLGDVRASCGLPPAEE